MPAFVFERRVRWEDCDSAQIIYYANYFKYLEAAEEEMLRTAEWSYKDLKAKYGITISKDEAECVYARPSSYDDLVQVHSSFGDLKGGRFTNYFEVQRGNDKLAEGYVKCICRKQGADLSAETALPAEMENIIRKYLRSE